MSTKSMEIKTINTENLNGKSTEIAFPDKKRRKV